MNRQSTHPDEIKYADQPTISFFSDFKNAVWFLTEKNEHPDQRHKQSLISGIEGDIEKNRLRVWCGHLPSHQDPAEFGSSS